MSRTLLLAPHNDDETLFAAFTLQREQPHVIVVLRAERDHRRREAETQEAVCRLTGSETYEQWTFDARAPRWKLVEQAIAALVDEYDVVYAPAFNYAENGHTPDRLPPPGWGVLQHDTVGWLAHRALGDRVIQYGLYTRWNGRDQRGAEVVPTGREIIRKLDALSRYETQIEDETTRPWFFDQLDLREWLL